ncbi:MAG: glutamate--tRNA ligase [Caldilineales bacterium]|nr:glutamate--tRNA ligase [Caldilineales bacterium]
MTTSPVRVRFAPSPTGFLHVGGARTALFNWLFARSRDGQFILRIEDTDRKRYHPQSLQDILDSLRWLGLDWDEGPEVGGPYGPYFQSQRLPLYQEWADWLVAQGKAYHCFCTAAEVEAMRQTQRDQQGAQGYDRRCRWLTPEERAARQAAGHSSVIRLAVPLQGAVTFHDAIRGDITFNNKELQDAVLLKSDGWPTYHLANVVDDHFMAITHILRGDEWLSSVPLHWHLYQAFGWQPPVWAHLPVILNPNGQGKMKKREIVQADGTIVPVYVHSYRQAGYLPDALFNFLCGIGWALDGETEIYDRETALAAFDIAKVQASPGAFPAEKLEWMNGVYIRQITHEALRHALLPHLSQAFGVPVETLAADERLRLLIPDLHERLKKLTDAPALIGFLFAGDIAIANPEDLIPRNTTREQARQALTAAAGMLAGLESWTPDSIEGALRALIADLNLKPGQVFGPMRVAITNQAVSPPLFSTIAAVGRETIVARLRQAAALLAA